MYRGFDSVHRQIPTDSHALERLRLFLLREDVDFVGFQQEGHRLADCPDRLLAVSPGDRDAGSDAAPRRPIGLFVGKYQRPASGFQRDLFRVVQRDAAADAFRRGLRNHDQVAQMGELGQLLDMVSFGLMVFMAAIRLGKPVDKLLSDVLGFLLRDITLFGEVDVGGGASGSARRHGHRRGVVEHVEMTREPIGQLDSQFEAVAVPFVVGHVTKDRFDRHRDVSGQVSCR